MQISHQSLAHYICYAYSHIYLSIPEQPTKEKSTQKRDFVLIYSRHLMFPENNLGVLFTFLEESKRGGGCFSHTNSDGHQLLSYIGYI